MSKLPPLPEFPALVSHNIVRQMMREYGAACRAAAIEECAKVCDAEGEQWVDHTSKLVGFHCAAAIRALLKDKP